MFISKLSFTQCAKYPSIFVGSPSPDYCAIQKVKGAIPHYSWIIQGLFTVIDRLIDYSPHGASSMSNYDMLEKGVSLQASCKELPPVTFAEQSSARVHLRHAGRETHADRRIQM